jgi:hypothetical protein
MSTNDDDGLLTRVKSKSKLEKKEELPMRCMTFMRTKKMCNTEEQLIFLVLQEDKHIKHY